MVKLAQERNSLFQNDEEYVRDLDILKNYIETEATFLKVSTGKPIELCRQYVAKVVANRKVKDVNLKVLRRDVNGDRVKDIVGFNTYLEWVIKTGSILAPNMIAYAHPDKIKSYTALFIDRCMKQRDELKHKQQRYKQLNDLMQSYFAGLGQTNMKFFNNSLSGASASEHNPLYYITKHTALTSGTRTETSSANVINEKLFASNRHYFSYDVTIDAIAYIIRETDFNLLEKVVKKYGVRVPTVDEVWSIIYNCTKHYWHGAKQLARLKALIGKLSDLELIAVAYVNDLKAMFDYSDTAIRAFFDKIIKDKFKTNYDEAVLKMGTSDIYALTGMLCYDFMKGLSPKDLKEKDPSAYQNYVNAFGNTINVLTEYSDFIRVFFVNNVNPQNIFDFPTSVRKAVPLSDTDSSIYTTERIVEAYSGKVDFSIESVSAGAIGAFFTATMVAHTILKASRQIGVAEEQKYRMEMKGEFFFPILLCTNLTKHYAYLTGACEGNVYSELELDMRGVQLKSSTLPTKVRNKALEWYEKLMLHMYEMKDLTPDMIRSYPAYVEHLIVDNIQNGSIDFYTAARINHPTNYKKPMSSNYVHCDLWNSVFADKYGVVTEFPYTNVKLPVTIDSRAKTMEWVNTLEPDLAKKMVEWMNKTGKTSFTNILVPFIMLPGGKVPKEFLPIVDVRGLLNQNLNHAYIFMTTCGIHVKNEKGSRLTMDEIPYDVAVKNILEMGMTLID